MQRLDGKRRSQLHGLALRPGDCCQRLQLHRSGGRDGGGLGGGGSKGQLLGGGHLLELKEKRLLKPCLPEIKFSLRHRILELIYGGCFTILTCFSSEYSINILWNVLRVTGFQTSSVVFATTRFLPFLNRVANLASYTSYLKSDTKSQTKKHTITATHVAIRGAAQSPQKNFNYCKI